MYSSKTAWEYIILSTFERKTAFSGIFKSVSAIFAYFGWHGGLFGFFNSVHHQALPRHSLH
jgi:hypothetical protein